MENLISLIISCLAVMTASLFGVFTVWRRIGDVIEKNLSLLVSFSSGVFLIVTLILFSEAVKHSGVILSLASLMTGILVVTFLFKEVPEFHHHHSDEDCKEEKHDTGSTKRILWGDALHNIGDGILLGTAFTTSLTLGWVTTLSVLVHELVQEMSEFFVLRHSGYSIKKSLYLNFAVSASILVGALMSFLLLDVADVLEGPMLALASGSFLVVVFHDLIPHSIKTSKSEGRKFRHLVLFALGMILMLALKLLIAESA